jgi:hypothetical protein
VYRKIGATVNPKHGLCNNVGECFDDKNTEPLVFQNRQGGLVDVTRTIGLYQRCRPEHPLGYLVVQLCKRVTFTKVDSGCPVVLGLFNSKPWGDQPWI